MINYHLPLLTSLLLCSCSSAIIQPSQAPTCQIPPALSASCELPAEIGPSLTYAQLIELDLQTREKLGLCAIRYAKLKASYQNCSDMLVRYNKGIEEALQTHLKKPSTPAPP